ncbi:MAG: C25 family cysteine peptidase, partial [Candidatus Omnitrophica bacterium]|nr:C25 family cysteine peptidase [Candidatus Omnitrophota bacterium]
MKTAVRFDKAKIILGIFLALILIFGNVFITVSAADKETKSKSVQPVKQQKNTDKGWYWFLKKDATSLKTDKVKQTAEKKTQEEVVIETSKEETVKDDVQPVTTTNPAEEAAVSPAQAPATQTKVIPEVVAEDDTVERKGLFGRKNWRKKNKDFTLDFSGQATTFAQRSTAAAKVEPLCSKEYSFQPPKFKNTIVLDQQYQRVDLAETENIEITPGAPLLPVKTAVLLVPYGQDVSRIKIIPGKEEVLSGEYLLEPAQEPVPLSLASRHRPTPPNKKIYDSANKYPQVPCDAFVQEKQGYKLVIVNLAPVNYFPAEKKLVYYPQIRVEVETAAKNLPTGLFSVGGSLNKPLTDAQAQKEILDLVDNPQALSTYTNNAVTNFTLASAGATGILDNFEYLIITTDALKNSTGSPKLQDLIAAKQARGITAKIVTVETDIYPEYAGEDNQEKIRNFIIDYYENHGTRYVLLAGDNARIPSRKFYAAASSYTANIPADMYYANLDGSFDYDNDGTYGEIGDGPGGGEVDLFSEVYVGRAPVASSTEIANFVTKTLAYEISSDSYLSKVYLVGEYLGFGGVADYAASYMEEIRLGSSAHGYTTVGFENSSQASVIDSTTLYDRDATWPASQLISIINSGVNVINHLGHANYTYDMKLYTSNLSSLNNDKYCFMYSQGCMPGGFDTSECFAEVVTTMSKGAFAAVMNARYGWGTRNSTDGPSQRYDRQFWDAFLNEGKTNLGKMNQDSKEDNAGNINGSCMRWCFYELNLFGDPELSIHFTAGASGPQAPANLNATINANKKVALSWQDESDDEEGFKLERSLNQASGFTQIATPAEDATSYTDTTVEPGTTYYYRINAYNGNGNSAYSNLASIATPDSGPVAPSNLSAVATSSSSINLTWQDNSTDEQGFNVERSLSATSGFVEIATVAAGIEIYNDQGLLADTRYYYRVRSYNIEGASAYSNVADEITPESGPAAPSNLTAVASSSSAINLNWTDNSTDEEGFKVERSLSGTGGFAEVADLAAGTTSLIDPGLNANTTYYYRVRSYNDEGASRYSNVANAKTSNAPPTIPTNPQAVAAGATSITVSWTDTANELGYEIQRSTNANYGF